MEAQPRICRGFKLGARIDRRLNPSETLLLTFSELWFANAQSTAMGKYARDLPQIGRHMKHERSVLYTNGADLPAGSLVEARICLFNLREAGL